MPSRKTGWRNNVNEKGRNFIVPNLEYNQFQQDGWKKGFFFRKNKLIMNL